MADKSAEIFPPAFNLPCSPLKCLLSKGMWSKGAWWQPSSCHAWLSEHFQDWSHSHSFWELTSSPGRRGSPSLHVWGPCHSMSGVISPLPPSSPLACHTPPILLPHLGAFLFWEQRAERHNLHIISVFTKGMNTQSLATSLKSGEEKVVEKQTSIGITIKCLSTPVSIPLGETGGDAPGPCVHAT